MQTSKKLNVAVIFGSRSVEHEVSIVTAMQVFEEIDKQKYNVIPIYIDKKGQWWTGKNLEKLDSFKNLELANTKGLNPYYLPPTTQTRGLLPLVPSFFKQPIPIDVVFPTIHGTFGEDGTLQGVLEMASMPYVGCGVTASALGMDKVVQKAIFEKEGLPVVKYLWFYREEWESDSEVILQNIEKKLSYPVFVKPCSLGSSIGINKAADKRSLTWAIEVAKEFDRKILIEEAVGNPMDVNCSVIGYKKLEVSVCEQPIKEKDALSYEDKYLKGGKTKGMAGLSRLIPAPISKSATGKIQEMSKIAFRAMGASGISRIDFLIDSKSEEIFINEINTLPGSLAFYLWEKSGLTFPQLIDKLIELAFERFEDTNKNIYSYDSKLLQSIEKNTKS